VKLLTKTNRYYFLLSLVLFGLGCGLLYLSLQAALAAEVEEQLLNRQQYLIQKTRQTHLPPSSPFDELMSVSTHPRPRHANSGRH
jgi:hypothetical protein